MNWRPVWPNFRWLQFRLRTAFVVLTLLGIGLGWHVNRPRLVLEGMCPVTVWEEGIFVPGEPDLAVTFMGCRYWFAGPAEREAFLDQPWRYALVLRGHDVVVAARENRLVPGHHQHGLWYRGRCYLFRDEDSLQEFLATPEKFADFAREAEQREREPLAAGEERGLPVSGRVL